MDLTTAVAILVTRVFTASMTDRLVPIAPGFQASLDCVLIGVDEGTSRYSRLEDRLDRCLLDVFQHVENDVAAALDQTEDRRRRFLQGAAAGHAFEPPAPARAVLLTTATGFPLCPAVT